MKDSYFYLISLRYAPGNWQHMASFASRLHDHAVPFHFVLSQQYAWMNEQFESQTSYITGKTNQLTSVLDIIVFLFFGWLEFVLLLHRHPPSAILLVMWHPLNCVVAAMVKLLQRDTVVLAWLHEPYKTPEDKRAYGAKAIVFYIVEFLQTLSLPFVDVVIVHSQKAFRSFNLRYPRYSGSVKQIPLQFRDEGILTSQRECITFLGNAAKAKGIDVFFELVHCNYERRLGLKFRIVTSSDISSYLKELPKETADSLEVVNKPQVSDKDLRHAAGSSCAVLALYKSTMQSGVIPLALMCGTPVIATDIEGLREYLVSDETAVFVSADPTCDEIFAAIHRLRLNFTRMSWSCRQAYLETFDDSNWERTYSWLFDFVSS